MVSILVKNADYIITLDKDRRIIKNGSIIIENDRILKIGKTSELEKEYKADSVIDATHKVVLPGLIDSHVHNTQILPRGLADECDLEEWKKRVTFKYEPNMTSEEAYWGVKLCQLEMIKNGTACFIEAGTQFADEVAKVTGDTGLRGVVSRGVFDRAETPSGREAPKVFETTEKAINEGEKIVTKWNNTFDGRLKACFCLRVPLLSSDELCLKLKELATKYNTFVESHVATTFRDVENSKLRWGFREIERLNRLGVLSSDFLAIHMGWVNLKEVLMLKENKVNVAMCLGASLHGTYGAISHGLFPEMLSLGINLCLGSDSGAAGNYYDIVRSMYLAASCFKDARLDESIMPSEKVLEMVTINAAKAALWDREIGSIEEGKKADLTIFDINNPGWRPLYNPISNLVYAASGHSADTLIVNGKVLMKNRKLTTIDEREVLLKAQEIGETIVDRVGLRDKARSRWSVV